MIDLTSAMTQEACYFGWARLMRQFDETDRILAARTRPALDHCRFRLWCWKQALGAPAETRAPLMIAAASSLRRSIAE